MQAIVAALNGSAYLGEEHVGGQRLLGGIGVLLGLGSLSSSLCCTWLSFLRHGLEVSGGGR